MSDAHDEPAWRGLHEILMHGSVALDQAEMRELLLVLQRFVTSAAQANQGDRALTYWLANLADGQIRAVLTRNFDPPFSTTITGSGSGAMAPMGMRGHASNTVPLPAETIAAANKRRHHDLNYCDAGILLLAVLAWLLFFVGPRLISEQPSADQSTLNDYWSGIPCIAVALTGYLIAHWPKAK